MGGGLIERVTNNSTNIYLTGSPEITFFKMVYKKYTNFSIETKIQKIFQPQFNIPNSIKITRSGDLISKVYLKIVMAEVIPSEGSKFAWVHNLGYSIIDYVEIRLGGKRIDKHSGHWLNIWNELSLDANKRKGHDILNGNSIDNVTYSPSKKDRNEIFVPLTFWFNKNYGSSLPISSLEYDKLEFFVRFRNRNEIIICNDNFLLNDIGQIQIEECSFITEHIYLDDRERKLFVKSSHEYLIEQLQEQRFEDILDMENKILFDFDHPVKELLWCFINGLYVSGNKFLSYQDPYSWTDSQVNATQLLIKQSIAYSDEFGINDPIYSFDPNYEYVGNQSVQIVNNWEIHNCIEDDLTRGIWINTDSLISPSGISIAGKYNFIIKIVGSILDPDNISLEILSKDILAIEDLSIPVNLCQDNRAIERGLEKVDDIIIYQWSNCGIYIDGNGNPFNNALIRFNGYERFKRREGSYFNYIQPKRHHTRTPVDGINVYSFSLFPEEYQPSGSANLSRFESKEIDFSFKENAIIGENNIFFIFGLSYNILRILSGISGLAYTGTN